MDIISGKMKRFNQYIKENNENYEEYLSPIFQELFDIVDIASISLCYTNDEKSVVNKPVDGFYPAYKISFAIELSDLSLCSDVFSIINHLSKIHTLEIYNDKSKLESYVQLALWYMEKDKYIGEFL